MSQDRLLAALSMDLKRIATSLHEESLDNFTSFSKEAKKTSALLKLTFDPRINSLLKKLDKVLDNPNKQELAEDALMYSAILQNYSVSRLKTK